MTCTCLRYQGVCVRADCTCSCGCADPDEQLVCDHCGTPVDVVECLDAPMRGDGFFHCAAHRFRFCGEHLAVEL